MVASQQPFESGNGIEVTCSGAFLGESEPRSLVLLFIWLSKAALVGPSRIEAQFLYYNISIAQLTIGPFT